MAFSASASETVEFAPNFFVVQEGETYRPDPARPQDLGLLLGEPGPLEAESLVLGYIVVPARFDPSREMEIWWNDRSVAAILAPAGTPDSRM